MNEHLNRTGSLQRVAEFHGPMPTGVTVSRGGRIFVNYPRWGDKVDFTVAELRDGQAHAYPDADINRFDLANAASTFVSVQSVVIDPLDRLWVLDTGNPLMQGTVPDGPKLVAIDLATDRLVKTIPIPPDVALRTTYLNDVRFDLRHGKDGVAYITDSSEEGPNGLIVIDLATGRAWRRLNDHPATKAEPGFQAIVDGRPLMKREPGKPPQPVTMGADGIAVGADGRRLYWCPLASRRLWSVDCEALLDERADDARVSATVRDEGAKPASDGLESDAQDQLYATDYEHGAILRRDAAGGAWETLVRDPAMSWPDTMSLADDGWLYFTANQLHRQPQYQDGEDRRVRPYVLLRVQTDGTPVRLA